MNARAEGEGRSPAEAATPGELLRAQREQRGLSVQQAAEDLHLDTWMIEAIEANRFLALGAPVYAKGHLRKYATLLGLSPDDVIARYQALSGTPAVPTPIPSTVAMPVVPERRSMKLPLWLGAGLIALAVVWGAVELWMGHERETEATPAAPTSASASEPQPQPEAAANPPPVAQAPVAEAAQPRMTVPQPAAVAREPVEAPQASRPAPASAGSGVVRVRLEFSEPSWTEIYDANGNRLMFDMGKPGRARTVSGVAPLRVTLGFADVVAVAVDDRPITIPRRPGKDAAKFTVAADGSVSP
jgi:cytoskeleton protein RodZ